MNSWLPLPLTPAQERSAFIIWSTAEFCSICSRQVVWLLCQVWKNCLRRRLLQREQVFSSIATVDKQDRLEACFELCGARLHDSVVPKHVFFHLLFQIPNVSFCLDLLPGLSLHPLLCWTAASLNQLGFIWKRSHCSVLRGVSSTRLCTLSRITSVSSALGSLVEVRSTAALPFLWLVVL